jgi:hypothetical protein
VYQSFTRHVHIAIDGSDSSRHLQLPMNANLLVHGMELVGNFGNIQSKMFSSLIMDRNQYRCVHANRKATRMATWGY